jgi:uncharacterized protein YggE
MKQFSTFVSLILAALVIFLLLSANLPTASAQTAAPATPTLSPETKSTCDPGRTIQVTGSALINVSPDRGLIQLGVQSTGGSPSAVAATNAAAIQSVIQAIRDLGVEAKDIATDWYVIEPVYENYDSLSIKGYRINNLVAVTVRDVSQVSPVISAALEAGANQIVNVDLYTSELRKYRDQARELAMKAAQEKAQALARAAGAETGCVLSINENSWSYYNGWGYGRSQSSMTQNVIQNTAPSGVTGSGAGDEPISLGQISVKADVTASFSLK